jgi:hypothetical protein
MISFIIAKSPKGSSMQVDFSKEEYRTFLEILEIADWVLFAHRTDEPENRKKYHNFEQKIFRFAEEMGFRNLIMYDEEMGKYFPTREHDENSSVMPFIEEFEEATFWDELADRLADRDMLRKIGEKKLLSMTREQRFLAHCDFEEKYQEEFQKHGIERLEIRD